MCLYVSVCLGVYIEKKEVCLCICVCFWGGLTEHIEKEGYVCMCVGDYTEKGYGACFCVWEVIENTEEEEDDVYVYV